MKVSSDKLIGSNPEVSRRQPKNLNEHVRFRENVVRDGLRNVASHHVESFNYAMTQCLPRINQYLLTAEVAQPPKKADKSQEVQYPFNKMLIWFEDLELKMPTRSQEQFNAANVMMEDGDNESEKMYPYECRLRSLTYSAPLYATIARKFDNEPEEKVSLCLGEIPVMVRSKFCNLNGLSEEELISKKEDSFEFGGYFIINGNERVVRMLVMNKRNYPVAFKRPTFINRGRLFSTFAVQMRCVRDDMFA